MWREKMNYSKFLQHNNLEYSALVDYSKVRLSIRERKVLKLAALGLDNPDIGKILYISPHTVKAHLKKTFRKLDVSNRTEAVYVAVKNHIIE